MYYYLNNAKIAKNLELYKCYMLIFYNELILLKFLSKILFKIFFSDYYTVRCIHNPIGEEATESLVP